MLPTVWYVWYNTCTITVFLCDTVHILMNLYSSLQQVPTPDPEDPDHHFVPLDMIYDISQADGCFRTGPDGEWRI